MRPQVENRLRSYLNLQHPQQLNQQITSKLEWMLQQSQSARTMSMMMMVSFASLSSISSMSMARNHWSKPETTIT